MAYLYVMRPDNHIRDLRRRAGISQTELAAAIGMHQTHFSKLENGLRPLTIEWARRIARVLKCSVADLLSDEDNPMRLDHTEHKLIRQYRAADAQQKQLIERVAEPVPGRQVQENDSRFVA